MKAFLIAAFGIAGTVAQACDAPRARLLGRRNAVVAKTVVRTQVERPRLFARRQPVATAAVAPANIAISQNVTPPAAVVPAPAPTVTPFVVPPAAPKKASTSTSAGPGGAGTSSHVE